VRNDPGTLAARRCVELGGNELGCVGKGFMTGLLGEGLTDFLSGKNSRTGLTMTGNYAGAARASRSLLATTAYPLVVAGSLSVILTPTRLRKMAMDSSSRCKPSPNRSLSIWVLTDSSQALASQTWQDRSSPGTTMCGCRSIGMACQRSAGVAREAVAAIGPRCLFLPQRRNVARSGRCGRQGRH
jgi:hypothetical protein